MNKIEIQCNIIKRIKLNRNQNKKIKKLINLNKNIVKIIHFQWQKIVKGKNILTLKVQRINKKAIMNIWEQNQENQKK